MSLNQPQFLSNGNYQKIVGFMRQQYAGRMGVNAVPERVDSRIQSTVQHYMKEVMKVHGPAKPVGALNNEVVREATTSIEAWLSRHEGGPMAMASPSSAPSVPRMTTVSTAAVPRPQQPMQQMPQVQPLQQMQQMQQQQRPATKPMATGSFDEINSLFDPVPKAATAATAASASWLTKIQEDEEEDPVVLMKKAQQQRESELLQSTTQKPIAFPSSVDPTPQAQPPPVRTTPLPQDYIIPQEPIVKYKETEYNIFITSSDRDWFRNRNENRYNFSVTFNPGNRTGWGYSPAVQERFRNIERIEFVKALLPTESLTTLVRNNGTLVSPVYNADRIVNVFSLPFLGVRIAELNNNGFSTNPREDNTFAIVQYDATWNSSVSNNTSNPAKGNVGYTAYIPKFLKCQKVYDPTPLAGLQKMTIRLERHDGSVLSTDSDVQAIARICLSGTTGGIATTNTSIYAQSDNSYIFIQTAEYFPFSSATEGDLINVQGYTVATPSAAGSDFETYINAPGSLYVVGVANVDTTTGTISDGPNSVGYCNILIVRSRFNNPATGSTGRTAAYFGGSNVAEGALATSIDGQASTASTAALINLSRQTHLVLRLITRDMDSDSNIRPDNV